MPYLGTALTRCAIALTAVFVIACGGSDSKGTDSGAAAAPPVDAFLLSASDGSWAGEVTPAGIVFRRETGGTPDSIVFEYRSPRTEGVILAYTSVRMAADTHRIDISITNLPCTDGRGTAHTHSAQVWVDQVSYAGCATRK